MIFFNLLLNTLIEVKMLLQLPFELCDIIFGYYGIGKKKAKNIDYFLNIVTKYYLPTFYQLYFDESIEEYLDNNILIKRLLSWKNIKIKELKIHIVTDSVNIVYYLLDDLLQSINNCKKIICHGNDYDYKIILGDNFSTLEKIELYNCKDVELSNKLVNLQFIKIIFNTYNYPFYDGKRYIKIYYTHNSAFLLPTQYKEKRNVVLDTYKPSSVQKSFQNFQDLTYPKKGEKNEVAWIGMSILKSVSLEIETENSLKTITEKEFNEDTKKSHCLIPENVIQNMKCVCYQQIY
jgi:hypothetical protein